MENFDDLKNSSYYIENIKTNKIKLAIIFIIFNLLVILLLLLNFKFIQVKKEKQAISNKTLILKTKTKNPKIYIDKKEIKSFSINKVKYHYEVILKFEENKRIETKIEEETTFLKNIIYDIRKEL